MGSDCMLLLGEEKGRCRSARVIHELIVQVDENGNYISMKYIFADKTSFEAIDKSPEFMNIFLHQNIAKGLIKMLEKNTQPRVKLTCNGEKDVSIPHFLIKLGFIPVNVTQE